MKIYNLTCLLSVNEYEALMRPVRGQGGFQTLLRSLQNAVDWRTRVLILTVTQINRIQKYYKQYGQGGFQGRLPELAKALSEIKDD
jgi:hypothetical protein